jgi:hypothetical protein
MRLLTAKDDLDDLRHNVEAHGMQNQSIGNSLGKGGHLRNPNKNGRGGEI